MSGRSEAVTRGIRILVRSMHVPDRSNPAEGKWFFAYTIRILNESKQTVQLLTRHWVITDANGRSEEVRGPGVVGEQPILEPGKMFEYTSACPLPTAFGSMEGSYEMMNDSGETFDVRIAPFTLSEPHAIN